jgi:phosphohistidine phosphatase
MKTLYLVRHAKSDWSNEGLADIDRPLNTRGYRDAHLISGLMKSKRLIPDLIFSSPAIRAISTALIFCRNFNLNCSDIRINSNLYEASVKQYIDIVLQLDDRFKSVMLFGHNPIISNLANSLTMPISESIPTCGCLGIRQSAHGEWKNFQTANKELVFYDFPKNHLGVR